MAEEASNLADDEGAISVRHDLPREVTSWRLTGLTADDGRVFLRCEFRQELGGIPDPSMIGAYKEVEERYFTVHWELASLKEFMRHLFGAATEIERRAGGPKEADIVALPFIGAEIQEAPGSSPTEPNGHHPGYL